MSLHKRMSLGVAVILVAGCLTTAAVAEESPVVGHWNITNTVPPQGWSYPSWLGVEKEDGKLQGRFLGGAGSVGPCGEVEYDKPMVEWNAHGRHWIAGLNGDRMVGISVDANGGTQWFEARRTVWTPDVSGRWKIESPGGGVLVLKQEANEITGRKSGEQVVNASQEGNHLTFTIAGRKVDVEIKGDVMVGTISNPDEKVKAVRQREWGEPIDVFNGKNLDNWKPLGDPNKYHWTVKDGIMVNDGPGGSANIVTKDSSFKNFKLHVEFKVPEHGNSGVYLRGRHEIQVADSYGADPTWHICGALYSRIAPSENACKKPGEWQTFDITLIDNYLTVVENGKTVIDNKEVEGITGGAIDSHELQPGPIYLQGDHGPISYRKITLTPTQ